MLRCVVSEPATTLKASNMADSKGPCSKSASGDSQEDFTGNVRSHLTGLSKQFASQTDACLLVEGQEFHVHKAFLAVFSTVFCDMFDTAQAQSSATGKSPQDKICVSMAGHTTADTSIALKFLYQRISGPSKHLWLSFDKTRPAIEFAHKFDMRDILEEADTCLSEAAQIMEDDGKQLFNSTDVTIAWASLAERFCLKKLLSEVELFLLQSGNTDLWQRSNPTAYQLPAACQLRVLRAAQQDRVAFRTELANRNKRASGWNMAMHDPVKYVDSKTLLSWQESSN